MNTANEPVEPQQDASESIEAAAADAAAAEDSAEQEIATLKDEVASLKDRLLRAVAETENVRKRGERDRDETAKYAISGFARDLVSVAENLKRASDSIPDDAKAADPVLKSLNEGVEMTLSELLGAFERHGIKRIDPLGEKFDHNYHQAVVQIETPDSPAGTVVQVLQAGYVIHDRLLRPAMVGVAKGASEAPKQVDTKA